MKIKDLQSSPHNPRKITDEKLRMLGKAMKEFGDLSGIVYNVRTRRIIGGHQRIKHLDPAWSITKREHQDKVGTVALGEIKTPFGLWQYREVDWPEKKEVAANIAANQHGGDFDYPKLKDLIIEIDDGETDMELVGFDVSNLEELFAFDKIRFEPVINPSISSHVVNDEEINKARSKIDAKFNVIGNYIEVMCPKCGAEFSLRKEDIDDRRIDKRECE